MAETHSFAIGRKKEVYEPEIQSKVRVQFENPFFTTGSKLFRSHSCASSSFQKPNIDPIELLTPGSSPLPLHPNLLIPRPTGDGTLNSRRSSIISTPSNGVSFLVMELWATLRKNSTTLNLKLGLIRSWPSARKKSSWRTKKVGRRPSILRRPNFEYLNKDLPKIWEPRG